MAPQLQTSLPALGAAVAGDQGIGEVPFDGRVVSASFIAEAVVTGVATNNRKLALVNKGQAGSGNVEVGSITFGAGVNAAAFDETEFTLSATFGNRVVKQGDILAAVETVNGTGLANPGGTVQVEVEPGT